MKNILFLIHPNHAIENWPSDKQKLKLYYDDVINYSKKFNGIIITHLMDPSGIGVWEDNSLWDLHDKFVNAIKSIADIVKYDQNELGSSFGNEFDELLLKYNPQKILIGGGYYGMCLRETYNLLHKQYGTYLKEIGTKIYKVPSLIFVPGPSSHRLSDNDIDEYQKEYVKKQSGSDNYYNWEGMPDGESFEVSESIEVILNNKKFCLEEGDTVSFRDKAQYTCKHCGTRMKKFGPEKGKGYTYNPDYNDSHIGAYSCTNKSCPHKLKTGFPYSVPITNKYEVSEDKEIVLNGKKFLLEKGDRIIIK